MDDKELLTMAAKAAGDIEILGYHLQKGFQIGTGALRWVQYWNPLTDDGDALRLAVKLKIDFYIGDDDDGVATYAGYFDPAINNRQRFAIERHDSSEPSAATRRAIVRAAALIGAKT